jgi:hypothetical protein
MMSLERAGSKLQLLIDRIRTATTVNAGWFDAVKVDEDALESPLRFRPRHAGWRPTEIATLLNRAEDAVQSQAFEAGAAAQLTAVIERLNNTFSQRQDAITG